MDFAPDEVSLRYTKMLAEYERIKSQVRFLPDESRKPPTLDLTVTDCRFLKALRISPQ